MTNPKNKRLFSSVRLPQKIAVFPLPNIILFPESEIPLYVFEPRYREMIAECMSGDKFIAISLMKMGWMGYQDPIPSHDVVGVGFLRAVFENPDGTYHILIKGVARARVTDYLQMAPFRVAAIEPVPDCIEDQEELERNARVLRKLFVKKMRWESDNPSIVPKIPKDIDNPVALSHLASFVIRANPYLKQDLLEMVNCNSRVRHLIDLLEEEIHSYGARN